MALSKFYNLLESGELVGYAVRPTNPQNLRWILIKKEKSYSPRLDDIDDEDLIELIIKEHDYKIKHPYRVSIRELPELIHDSDRYENQEDYVVFENFRFSSPEEVINFLNDFNIPINDIRSAKDINAP